MRTSRPSSTCPPTSSTTTSLEALAELRPEDEDGLVLARRVFGDGRTRAYAWGRSAAREDVGRRGRATAWPCPGQFEQRRLARPSYQLDVLDAFAGAEQLQRRGELRAAWRELRRRAPPSRRAHARRRAARRRGSPSCAPSSRTRSGFEPGLEEALRARARALPAHGELVEATAAAAAALDPEDGDGAADLIAAAERCGRGRRAARARARLGRRRAARRRAPPARGGERAAQLPRLARRRPGARLEEVEAQLERIADAKRRFRVRDATRSCSSAPRRRKDELASSTAGGDPVGRGGRGAGGGRGTRRWRWPPSSRRRAAPRPSRFAAAVAAELAGIGMGEGEFHVELRERAGRPRADGSGRGRRS